MAGTDAARPRTRTLWMIAAAFAVTGVLLLHHPRNGDHPGTVEPPQPSSDEPDGDTGHIVTVPPSRPQIGPGTPSAETPSPEPTPSTRARATNGPEPWGAAATGYANALTARVDDHAEWVAGLRPWVTRHLAEQYEHTDPARRPHGAVSSVETVTPGDYAAHVKIAYDTGLVLMVRLAYGPEGWRVTYAEPVAGG